MGPSPAKLTEFDADWYLIAADPSAIPVAAVALEAMPRDSKGIAIFEITAREDRQDIDAPKGIAIHWLIHPDPHTPSTAQIDFIKAMFWPEGARANVYCGGSFRHPSFARLSHQRQTCATRGHIYLRLLENRPYRGPASTGQARPRAVNLLGVYAPCSSSFAL